MNARPVHPSGSQHATAASRIEAEAEVPVPAIDLSIYVMPAFATLTVSDLDASRRWYVEGLGFAALAEVPGPTGDVALLHLRRWRYQDLLLVPGRSHNASPARGIRLTFSADGTDLDALAQSACAVGGSIGGVVEGPSATTWNTRDMVARDRDGYEIVFTSALPVDAQDPEFAARMERVQQQVLAERAERSTSQN